VKLKNGFFREPGVMVHALGDERVAAGPQHLGLVAVGGT
jgi:hypothetical protein